MKPGELVTLRYGGYARLYSDPTFFEHAGIMNEGEVAVVIGLGSWCELNWALLLCSSGSFGWTPTSMMHNGWVYHNDMDIRKVE